MNDVWLVMQKVSYEDGSTREFVSSAHGTRESAEVRLSQKTVRRELNMGRRRQRSGYEVIDSTYKIDRWMVQ